MEVKDLRGYGVSFSDAESLWPLKLKKKMRRDGQAVVLKYLGFFQRIRFFLAFWKAKRRARKLDLSDIQAKGMTNQSFLAQQIEYISMFAALAQVLGTQKTIEVVKDVMVSTAKEPLLLCLPDLKQVKQFPDSVAVFREYLKEGTVAAAKAGCHGIKVEEDHADAIQLNITYCVWLELSRKMGVPEACLPNCYADDLVFPEYFTELGIQYKRTGTLAQGCTHCDFRFERMKK